MRQKIPSTWKHTAVITLIIAGCAAKPPATPPPVSPTEKFSKNHTDHVFGFRLACEKDMIREECLLGVDRYNSTAQNDFFKYRNGKQIFQNSATPTPLQCRSLCSQQI